MKKIIFVTLTLIMISSCKAQQIDSETNVLKALNKEIVKYTVSKRVKNHGIVFKEYDDYSWVIDFMAKDPFKEGRVLNKTNDSLTLVIFNKKNRENYTKQLKKQGNDFSKFNFNDEKIASYSDKLEDKLEKSKFVKFNTSKPVFSIDKEKAIVFASSSHEAIIYLFQKTLNSETKLKEWKVYKKYNSIFSNMNY